MTAVANLPSLQQDSRSRWDISGGQVTCDPAEVDKLARRLLSKKVVQRPKNLPSTETLNSLSSLAANNKSRVNAAAPRSVPVDNSMWVTAGPRKKVPKPEPWPNRRSNSVSNFKVPSNRLSSDIGTNEFMVQSSDITQTNQRSPSLPSLHTAPSSSLKSNGSRSESQLADGNLPILCLLSMNGTFDRKTIYVPFYPESVRIGRQTNTKTIPTPVNGYFDSKVLSRQHAELWADKNGIIWIRDIKSSNGTFVNGARLSLENRESQPHELEAQDQLELGIDIVSEDQKTVVHHKVAAKVEFAGFPMEEDNTTCQPYEIYENTIGTNLGSSQGQTHMRTRIEAQNTNGNFNRSRTPANVTNNHLSLGQQRPMKFWLTPVTMEQIVKRLTHEIRMARLQTNELTRTHDFLGSLLHSDHTREVDKLIMPEAIKPSALANSIARPDQTSCFSAPPAPPPQQPLPEKPDFARSIDSQAQSLNSKRTSIERSRSISSISPVCSETPRQVVTLMEALATSKKEIDSQSAKLQDLEGLLLKEKQAREFAEDTAKRLESQSDSKKKGILTVSLERSDMEEAFETFVEVTEQRLHNEIELISPVSGTETESQDNKSTDGLESNLETIFAEMGQLKSQLITCNVRADKTSIERDADQKSLAEMVEKIRLDEAERNKLSQDEHRCHSDNSKENCTSDCSHASFDANHKESVQQDLKPNNKVQSSWVNEAGATFEILAKNNSYYEPFLNQHTAPFASMLGIVLIGVGIMSYLNGWHVMKVER